MMSEGRVKIQIIRENQHRRAQTMGLQQSGNRFKQANEKRLNALKETKTKISNLANGTTDSPTHIKTNDRASTAGIVDINTLDGKFSRESPYRPAPDNALLGDSGTLNKMKRDMGTEPFDQDSEAIGDIQE